MATVEGQANGEIDVKRFYIHGVVLRDNCPKCHQENKEDFGEQYLSYPTAGESFELFLCCGKCRYNWSVWVKLIITLELANG